MEDWGECGCDGRQGDLFARSTRVQMREEEAWLEKEVRAMDRKPLWFFPLNVSLKPTHQSYKTRSTCPKCGGQRTSSLWQMWSFQTMRDLDKQTSLLDLLNPCIFVWFSSWIVRHECWYKSTYGLVESYRTDTNYIVWTHFSFLPLLTLPCPLFRSSCWVVSTCLLNSLFCLHAH